MKKTDLEVKPSSNKFGAFSGVFVPTFLSIIGVILFLRLGLIVGNGGILSAIAIILLAVSVTLATGLSISSITTNMKISSGGAYSIISKTLGLEVGGSIGIPLFIAQVFSVTLYLFGFSEVWKFIFPAHNTIFVLLGSFLVIFSLTLISTRIAVKAQTIILFGILIAIATLLFNTNWIFSSISQPLIGSFTNYGFWQLFALFFPAVTGILVGIGLSGELQDPKKQIPRGMISAIVSTSIIYILVAIWLSVSATHTQLIADNLIMVKLAIFAPFILIGILASTFSSALTTFVSAPKLLVAMSEKSLFPGSGFLAKQDSRGIASRAILFTSLPVIITLFISSLDKIAPIITVFFLITYAIINLVVYVEQSIGLVSFRPTLKIPKVIPLYGAVLSMAIMFFISPLSGVFSLVFVFLIYLYLVEKKLVSKEGDIRSGLFITFSEWAARKVMTLPESTKHTWKPNVLLPVVSTSTLLGNFPIIKSITYPNGMMTVLGLDISKIKSSPEETTKKKIRKELKELKSLVKKFGEEGIFTSSSNVIASNYTDAVTISLEAIGGQTFPPNILFLPFKPKRLPLKDINKIFNIAETYQIGIILADRDEEAGLGAQQDIHVWLSANALNSELQNKEFDLSLLIAYRLYRNWAGKINVWMCVSEERATEAERYIKKLLYDARFPTSTKINISTKSIRQSLKSAPKGDIHLYSITKKDVKNIRKISDENDKTIFFVADSGKEDILA